MEHLCYILFIYFCLFSLSYSINSKNSCFIDKFQDSFCSCHIILSSEQMLIPELETTAHESQLRCIGGNALEASVNALLQLKGNFIFMDLIISNSTFDIISLGHLKHFPYLKSLNFIGNSFSSIDNDAFKEQKHLEVLNLSSNHIPVFKNHMLKSLQSTSIKNLSLSDNMIYKIEENAFHKLYSLLYLDLSYNKLTAIDGNWFADLRNLYILSLSHNKIGSLEVNSFHNLVSLQTLDLSFNKLKIIPHLTFFRLKNLKFVSLAMNELETLNEIAFKGNNMLEKVNLTGNLWNCDKKLLPLNEWLKKYQVDKDAFCIEPEDLKNYTIQQGLEILFLELKIQESPTCNHTMCNCTIAKDKLVITVDCSGRGFTRLPDVVPYKTKALNLYNNKIKSLTTDHIDANMWSDVSFLYLNNNVIDSLKGLEGTWLLRNLVALHLSNNQLTEIPIHILEQFRGGLLDELYLSGNPWNCDCNTVRFQTWLQDNYRTVRNFDGICCSSDNGIYSNKPIYRLLRSQLCPQHVQFVNYLDVLNGLMALTIIIIVSKLSYDYWLQKRTGKLPRFFSLNFM